MPFIVIELQFVTKLVTNLMSLLLLKLVINKMLQFVSNLLTN